MRLLGCVAIELLGFGLIASSCAGALYWGAREVRESFGREASAAEVHQRATQLAAPLAVEHPAVEWDDVRIDVRPAKTPWSGLFGGQLDDLLVEPLLTSPIKEVKINRGGTSLSLRFELENGAMAAVKPNQIHRHSQPRREIAAYRINRLLGLSTVPPAIGRRFAVDDIVDHLRADMADQAPRVLAEMIPEENGEVLAEMSWWIPVLKQARIGGFEIDSVDGAVTWARYLTVGAPIPYDELELAAQLSDLVAFDFLINNIDRWSGGNVKASEDGTMLYFMDNTMSFGDDPDGHSKVRTYLQRCQKFSHKLIQEMRYLSEDDLREAVSRDVAPFDVLLDEEEIAATLSRRDELIRYVDQLIATHGQRAVLVFP